MACAKKYSEGDLFFSQWFHQTSLNHVAQWIAAIFERKIVMSYVLLILRFLDHIQEKITYSEEFNPVAKQKNIRKYWRTIDEPSQVQKIIRYASEFHSFMVFKDRHTERLMNCSNEFVMMLREIENKNEIKNIVEYALRLKNRKDPSLFIDCLFCPNLDQVSLIARYHLHFLTEEILSAITLKNFDQFCDEVSSKPNEKVINEKSKQTKNKQNKKSKMNSNSKKKNIEDDANTKIEPKSSVFCKDIKIPNETDLFIEQAHRNLRDQLYLNDSDDNWVSIGDKKKHHRIMNYINKDPQPISDSEAKKSNSNKKKLKKHSSKRKAFGSVGHSEQTKAEDSILFKQIEMDPFSNNEEKDKRPEESKLSENIDKKSKQHNEMNNGLDKKGKIYKSPENKSINTSVETESVDLSMEMNKPRTEYIIQKLLDRDSKIKSPKQTNSALYSSTMVEINDNLENGLFAFSQQDDISNAEDMLTDTPQSREELPGMKDQLERSIKEVIRDIDMNAQAKQQHYKCSYERIKYLVLKSFVGLQSLQVVIYGSLATGLSVPGSDMDLCVVGFKDIDRQQSLRVLQTITDNLKLFKWCKDITFIQKSRIPVVKLEVDPCIAFEMFNNECNLTESMKSELLHEKSSYLNLLSNDTLQPYDHNISADITIDFLNENGLPENAGLRTSSFVLECIKNYMNFRELVLVVKWMLAGWGLNKSYTGRYF